MRCERKQKRTKKVQVTQNKKTLILVNLYKNGYLAKLGFFWPKLVLAKLRRSKVGIVLSPLAMPAHCTLIKLDTLLANTMRHK